MFLLFMLVFFLACCRYINCLSESSVLIIILDFLKMNEAIENHQSIMPVLFCVCCCSGITFGVDKLLCLRVYEGSAEGGVTNSIFPNYIHTLYKLRGGNVLYPFQAKARDSARALTVHVGH